MIVDIRTYDIVPRKMKAYLNLFEEYALPVMRRYVPSRTHVGLWKFGWLRRKATSERCRSRLG